MTRLQLHSSALSAGMLCRRIFPAPCSLACQTRDSIEMNIKIPWSKVKVASFSPGAHAVREEPRFVTARAGESVILGCDVSPPLDGQQPPYVVEWFKFGVPIPFFINFRFYPPHVDPEYTGKTNVAQEALKESIRRDVVKSRLYLSLVEFKMFDLMSI